MRKLKCYDIQDIYKKIPKKDRIVDEKTFGHVVKAYFQNMVDAVFDFGQVTFPHGMGGLVFNVIDVTPYYDVKTGKIHGGRKMNAPYLANKECFRGNKIIKVRYFKGKLCYNPFRFFRFEKSRYLQNKIGYMYKTNNFNTVNIKKI